MNDEQPTMSIDRVQVLGGHTSAETAYLVEDYPYGFQLRCKIRYWVETATKGAAKGRMRFMSQTTNPKRPGEVWNKPKASTYTELAVMYLDEINHVQWWSTGYHMSPADDARARLMGMYDQLTESDRARYDVLLKVSHKYQVQWDEWEEKLHAIMRHIEENGTDPVVSDGIWQAPQRRYYLGKDTAVYVATARRRLES